MTFKTTLFKAIKSSNVVHVNGLHMTEFFFDPSGLVTLSAPFVGTDIEIPDQEIEIHPEGTSAFIVKDDEEEIMYSFKFLKTIPLSQTDLKE